MNLRRKTTPRKTTLRKTTTRTRTRPTRSRGGSPTATCSSVVLGPMPGRVELLEELEATLGFVGLSDRHRTGLQPGETPQERTIRLLAPPNVPGPVSFGSISHGAVNR